MCSISCLRLTLLILFVGLAIGYQITSETDISEFPVQEPNYNNGNTFFRITNGTEKEEIECPEGYSFDLKKNHCVKEFTKPQLKNCFKSDLEDGDHSYPDNCQKYLGCIAKCCYLMPCPDHLLFNEVFQKCVYPYQAQCCEYVEKNSDRLVQ